jgi:hypothetical protein
LECLLSEGAGAAGFAPSANPAAAIFEWRRHMDDFPALLMSWLDRHGVGLGGGAPSFFETIRPEEEMVRERHPG